MSGNELQSKALENQDENYERTVLNFLNSEMAHSQPGDGLEKQSKELDSIVSDLLKQVISESDSQQENPKLRPEDPFSEFPDAQNTNLSVKESPALQAPPETIRGAQPRAHAAAAPAAIPIPGASTVAKGRFPIQALALACALVLMGSVAYFLSSRRGASPEETSLPAAASPLVAAESARTASAPADRIVDSTANQEVRPAAKRGRAAEKPAPEEKASKDAAGEGLSKAAAASDFVKPDVAAPVDAPADAIAAAPAPALVSPISIEIEERESAPPSIIERSVAQPQSALLAPMKESPELELKPISNGSAPKNLLPAEPVSRAKAVYPAIALRTRASGTVVVEAHIDNTGKVIKASPVSGPAIFHDEAVKAVMKWRYKPASLNGVHVASKSKAEIVFNLK